MLNVKHVEPQQQIALHAKEAILLMKESVLKHAQNKNIFPFLKMNVIIVITPVKLALGHGKCIVALVGII